MLWFLCNLADEKEESLPSVSKPFVTCNSLLSSLLERRRDAFKVHLAPNHRLLYELAVNPPVSSTQMHQGHGRSLGPVPSTHLQKPPWEDASPSHPAKACKTARQASKIGPSGSRAQSQMGRALEEREAERCQSLLHGSTMERERPGLPRKVRPRVHR